MGKQSRVRDSILLRPRWRLLCGGKVSLGPGRVELLEWIDQAGSVRAAAERMGMSYMRAWTLVKDTNRAFSRPIVVVVRGGKAGGGAQLTQTGRRVVELYRRLERESQEAVAKTRGQLRGFLRR